MTDTALLGPWLRRFLLEHLVNERNLSRNTRLSYRDTLVLLIGFLTRKLHHSPEKLTVVDVSPDLVQAFLLDLEESRHCSIPTRNQRLAAIRSLARFIGMHSPEHIVWCGQMRCIPMKRSTRRLLPYLEKPEMEALLAAPDAQTAQGRRDRTLLWFLYNSGTRADEAAQLTIADLQLVHSGQSWVTVMGKGRKIRPCPLWPKTAAELHPLIAGRALTEHVFLNRRGQPLTRFGIHALVKRYVQRAATKMPSLATKRISPHTIRHYVPFLTMSCNRSLAHYFRPRHEASKDIVLTHSTSPAAEERDHSVSCIFDYQLVLPSAEGPSCKTYPSVCKATARSGTR
jgi:site-specific recombinase XerD